MTTKITTTITHEGVDYAAEIATIKAANLGFEDHGILAWNLDFDGVGWGQGTGYRGLGDDGYAVRVIRGVLETLGARDWSNLKGVRAYILRTAKDSYGAIVGIASLDGRVLIIDSIAGKDAS